MPYKISGDLSDTVRIIVIKESDWSIESNTTESASSYELFVTNSAKTVLARKSDGEGFGYGNITPDYVVGDRGVFGGGFTTGIETTIEYITISTTGNANDFGELTVTRGAQGATSNGTNDRGVFGGGNTGAGAHTDVIDYITISVLENAANFGDLTVSRYPYNAAVSNNTNDRGVFAGGWDNTTYLNVIDYITISITGNANDFGDLTQGRHSAAGLSNGTGNRGVFSGGRHTSSPTHTNVIDYITISSTPPSNATDFGDLTEERRAQAGASNGTRGIFGGGRNILTSPINSIDYITIASTGDATDFGDLTVARTSISATSNNTSDRGVFAGGWNGVDTIYNTTDYVTISTTSNANDFGDLAEARWNLAATSNA